MIKKSANCGDFLELHYLFINMTVSKRIATNSGAILLREYKEKKSKSINFRTILTFPVYPGEDNKN